MTARGDAPALGFARLEVIPEKMPPALQALHVWLGLWTGIGLIELGMAREGYDLWPER
jgi:hypothetical protein